ncbi:MFS transporter [Marinomonas sp.]|nr:MFS transporter [Marinomonas sp.]MDB4837459.1 MFS transporter [Marinomonas sp.]
MVPKEVAFLMFERLCFSLCFGLTILFPKMLITAGYDLTDYGSISSWSSLLAIISLLIYPLIQRFVGDKRIDFISGIGFVFASIIAVYSWENSSFSYTVGLIVYSIYVLSWVLHFTRGSIVLVSNTALSSRKQFLMLYATVSAAGICLGPIIGKNLLLYLDNYSLIFISILFFSSLNLMTTFIRKRDFTVENLALKPKVNLMGHLRGYLNSRSPIYVITIFICITAYTGLINFQIIYSELESINSDWFYIFWFVGLILSRILFGRFVAQVENEILIYVSLSIYAIGTIGMLFVVHSVILYMLVSTLLGVSFGVIYPVVQEEVIKKATEETKEFAQVCFSLAYFSALYFMPKLHSYLISEFGFEMFWTSLGALLVCTLISLALIHKFLASMSDK